MRKTHHLEQGSEAWHAHRNTPGMINASEVAAIMGLCRYTSRSELLRRKATGIEPEHSEATQRRFDKGHEDEAMARPYAEELIGDDLSALVMTDTIDGITFSASLDGITQDYGTTFEHKSLNMILADSLDAGVIPEEYHPQMEVGLMVSGAQGCLFMASKDGDAETARHQMYLPNPELRKRIIAACKQFQLDLENYQHTEATVEPVAATIEALPALMIQVEGKVLATNLDQFKASAQKFIANINTNLQTDQDFADADKMVKFLKDGEYRLELCKAQALAQTASIDELFRTIDAISDQMKDKRLMLDKLVAAEKTNRKQEIVDAAIRELVGHTEKLNQRLGDKWMPQPKTGLMVEAVRGLKSLTSMRDKVSAALANAKIEANEIADRIEANYKSLKQLGQDYTFLFPDLVSVCTKAQDDFAGLYAIRLSRHRTAEEKRIEAEREKIRKEEAERITKEAARADDAIAQVQAVIDQRGKADAGVGLSPDGRAQPEAASTPPIPKATVSAPTTKKPFFIDEQRIDDFLSLTPMGPIDKKALRINLVKWERYRIACEQEVMI